MLQDLQVPSGIEGDFVVGNPQGSLLQFRQSTKLNDWHFVEPQCLGGKQPSMASNQLQTFIDQDWIGEAKATMEAWICSIWRLG